jgi:hypothetical protein
VEGCCIQGSARSRYRPGADTPVGDEGAAQPTLPRRRRLVTIAISRPLCMLEIREGLGRFGYFANQGKQFGGVAAGPELRIGVGRSLCVAQSRRSGRVPSSPP